MPHQVSARIDALMRRTIGDQHLAGASLAIGRRDGTIVYAAGFGIRNVAKGAAADRGTVYNIASITKQFTSAAILLLAQEHRLSIEDSLARYVPELPVARSVTLHELMDQTSGIPDFFYLPGYAPGMTARDITSLVSKAPQRFRPGTAYEYSNSNFVLLGLVIEKVAAMPYASFVAQRLFRPAGMRSSRIGDVPGNGLDDATGYAARDAGFEAVAATPDDLAFGAGAIDATAPDLVRWATALSGGRILDGEETRRYFGPRTALPGTSVRYAFGTHELGTGDERELYHRGRNAGYGGLLATYPGDGLTIAILANAEQLAPMYLAGEIHDLLASRRAVHHEVAASIDAPSERSVDVRARRWLQDLAASHIDRDGLTAEAAARYSDTALREVATRLQRYGRLNSIALMEIDARYFGRIYGYRARFERAIVEYRFGLASDGKVWNLAVDRED